MGSKRENSFWLIMICIIMWNARLSCPLVQGTESYKQGTSLDSFLYDYAIEKTTHSRRPRAGKLYDVSLPANFSGMELSFVRLRARSLWKNGANFSSFSIPPMISPRPFTRRVDIIFQNLGNWSSSYYDVPNHTFVAPVLGSLAYDPQKRTIDHGLIELNIVGKDPITIMFPNIKKEGNEAVMKCVRFDTNGSLEFSNLTVGSSSCVVRKQGHFTVVIPYEYDRSNRDKGGIKWWKIVGIAAGVLVLLVLISVVFTVGCKWIKEKRIKKMERESERSEELGTIWIGRSRMPSASGIRTQPVLESGYLP